MIEEIEITSLAGRGSVMMRNGDYKGYWLGPVDWGQVEGQHQTYSYYNQVGESIVSTTVRSRPLSITGWVIAPEGASMRQRCDFLNAFFSPAEDYVLTYRSRKIQFRPDRSVIYSRERRTDNDVIRQFLLQATCPYPLFTDVTDTAVPFDEKNKLFHFPTDWGRTEPIVFAAAGKAYHMRVNNTGGFATGLRAEFFFSGEVINPRIKNITTGKFTGLTRTFHRGETLMISTTPGQKYLILRSQDGTETDIIKYRDYRMSWIQLVPGVNQLSLDCDDLDQRANMTVTVYFTPLYLEVE